MFSKELKRAELYSLLGDLPDRDRPISSKLVYEEEHENYIIEKLILDLNDLEYVPAYFVKPKNAAGKRPTVVFSHSHGGNYKNGKDELLNGTWYLAKESYATALTRCGMNALCIDSWAFGERMTKTESYIFKEMLVQGRVMWGMMVYDSIRAVDYLFTREDVDTDKIAAVGMSMGSTMSWWLAALDTRISVCAEICCLTDIESLMEEGGIDHHGIFYYVPGLLKYFTTAQINALIAPRRHLSLNGVLDNLTPVKGLQKIDAELRAVYEKENASDAWKMFLNKDAHLETDEMRKMVIDFLEESFK